jgi:hypothetical protein
MASNRNRCSANSDFKKYKALEKEHFQQSFPPQELRAKSTNNAQPTGLLLGLTQTSLVALCFSM